MRILLAVDGSVSGDRATELVSSFALPPDSVIRVVGVHRPYTDALALTWVGVGDAGTSPETADESGAHQLRDAIARAEGALKRTDITVEGFLLHGRPGTSIVDEATAFAADLVVVGSRGHGTIATMLLGSTASEVVDHAPCPVLVARHRHLEPLAFADDGSGAARHAETVFSRWPIFAGMPVSVVSVAEVAIPVAAGYTPGLYDQVLESYAQTADEVKSEVAADAANQAHRLEAVGLRATPVALEGDPAAEIVRYAAEAGIATIVIGTRGRTGLARLILGSTARNVLLHAPCSVLVVRQGR